MFLSAGSTFWPSRRAKSHQDRDCRGLLVDFHQHDRAIQDQPDDVLVRQTAGVPGFPIRFDLATSPTRHVLAHGTIEHRRKRVTDPAAVRSSQLALAINASAAWVRRW